MKIEQIIPLLGRDFPEVEPESVAGLYALDDALRPFLTIDNDELASYILAQSQRGELKRYRIFDASFDPDEACHVYLFAYHGKPTFTVESFGSDYVGDLTIIDHNKFHEQIIRLSTENISRKMNDMRDKEFNLSNAEDSGYVTLLDDGGAFIVDIPSTYRGFEQMAKSYPCYLFDQNGPVKVSQISSFVGRSQTSSERFEVNITCEDGSSGVVDGRSLNFLLAPSRYQSPEDFQRLQTCVSSLLTEPITEVAGRPRG